MIHGDNWQMAATTWKVTLEYDGTRYSGWQEQHNARTVMGELRRACEAVFGGPVELQGSGRTDSGVHALAQVVHLRTEAKIARPTQDLIRALNEELPADIAVYEIGTAPQNFHARHDATGRVYRYQISTRKTAFSKKYVWWIKEPLDIGLMEQASAMIEGRHDFQCFRAEDPSKAGESTIVVVSAAKIEVHEHLIVFRIEASHYLWRMVRRLVGVLVKVGRREMELSDFAQLVDGRCDPRLNVAAWTAPSSGLFLEEVHYADAAKPEPSGGAVKRGVMNGRKLPHGRAKPFRRRPQ